MITQISIVSKSNLIRLQTLRTNQMIYSPIQTDIHKISVSYDLAKLLQNMPKHMRLAPIKAIDLKEYFLSKGLVNNPITHKIALCRCNKSDFCAAVIPIV